jgi:hypothetical protein
MTIEITAVRRPVTSLPWERPINFLADLSNEYAFDVVA